MRKILCLFVTLLGLTMSPLAFANIDVKNLQPGETWGEVSVQVRAASIYQYQPIVLCDSFDFQMRHFSSVYRNGILNVELRYTTKGFPLGAACSVFFVEDDLAEFDFEMGFPLLSARESFRFVIQ